MMVAKYLERIGDHATNVAEWMEYSITGVHRPTTDIPCRHNPAEKEAAGC